MAEGRDSAADLRANAERRLLLVKVKHNRSL